MAFKIIRPITVGYTDTDPLEVEWIKFDGKTYMWSESNYGFETMSGERCPKELINKAYEMRDERRNNPDG